MLPVLLGMVSQTITFSIQFGVAFSVESRYTYLELTHLVTVRNQSTIFYRLHVKKVTLTTFNIVIIRQITLSIRHIHYHKVVWSAAFQNIDRLFVVFVLPGNRLIWILTVITRTMSLPPITLPTFRFDIDVAVLYIERIATSVNVACNFMMKPELTNGVFTSIWTLSIALAWLHLC